MRTIVEFYMYIDWNSIIVPVQQLHDQKTIISFVTLLDQTIHKYINSFSIKESVRSYHLLVSLTFWKRSYSHLTRVFISSWCKVFSKSKNSNPIEWIFEQTIAQMTALFCMFSLALLSKSHHVILISILFLFYFWNTFVI